MAKLCLVLGRIEKLRNYSFVEYLPFYVVCFEGTFPLKSLYSPISLILEGNNKYSEHFKQLAT